VPANGSYYSSVIDYYTRPGLKLGWDELSWTKNNVLDDISIDIEYWNGSSWLPSPLTGLDNNSGEDLFSIPPSTYSNIRLKVRMFDGATIPVLLDWTLTWNTNHEVHVTKNADVSSYGVTTNDVDNTVMAVHVQDTAGTDTLKSFAVANLGTMSNTTEISAVKIYKDNGSTPNAHDGSDLYIDTLAWNGAISMWSNGNVAGSHTIGGSGIDIVVTIDISSGPVIGKTFKGRIPSYAVGCDNNVMGPSSAINNSGILTVDVGAESVLLIGDLGTSTTEMNTIELILNANEYNVTKEDSHATVTSTWSTYDYLIYTSEDGIGEVFDDDEGRFDEITNAIMQYVLQGGLLLISGGDMSYYMDGMTAFEDTVLHSRDAYDEGLSNFDADGTHFINTNRSINSSLSYSDGSSSYADQIYTANGSVAVYYENGYSSEKVMVAYDAEGTTADQGQIVFFPNLFQYVIPADDRTNLLLNCMDWLTFEAWPNDPSDLRCEGITTPGAVTVSDPELSWIFSDPENDTQLAYRIQVGTTPGSSDMWDSFKEMSSSTNVIYDGAALSSFTTYFWHVKVWEDNDLPSGWSASQFGMGDINFPPNAPTISGPFDNALIGDGTGSPTPFLQWSVPLDANSDDLHFKAQWAQNSTFTSNVVTRESTNVPANFSNTPALGDGTGYAGYRVQGGESLNNGETYWVRAAAIDPAGANQYGAWSAGSSFTVSNTVSNRQWFQTSFDQFNNNIISNCSVINAGGGAVEKQSIPPGMITIFTDGFETNSFWGTTGEWERGDPDDAIGPFDAYNSINCYGVDLDDTHNIFANDMLTSPDIPVNGKTGLTLE
ncbi:hypothetical protein ACFL6D_05415, partial [Spirochaetota bacterium]